MSRSKFRNLFLIGNGFDRWQGLPTSYGSFHEYFLEHVDEAPEALGIEKLSFLSADGKEAIL